MTYNSGSIQWGQPSSRLSLISGGLRATVTFPSVRLTVNACGTTCCIGGSTITVTATSITATVDLDGTGAYAVETGVGFLDHMIEQLARHSMIDIFLKAKGDLHIDQHHTTEDSGIVLGQAVANALGDKEGIARYGSAYLPMDETLTRVAIDISGRPFLVWKVEFTRSKVGEMDTELFREWFQAFAQHAGITLHVETLYGENSHHIAETCYKALARALRQAVAIDERQGSRVPSTKGQL